MNYSKKLKNNVKTDKTSDKINKIKELFNESYSRVMKKQNLHAVKVSFSNRFKKYNGKLTFYKTKGFFELKLSSEWKNISSEIIKGLLEELISALLKKKHHSTNIELYRRFIRNLDVINFDIKKSSDKELLESFNRVNEKYFNNILDGCIVKFGNESRSKLGEYNFHSDTITISKLLKDAPLEILDYVMYHEMIHKYLKISLKGKIYHSKEFKELESKYEGWPAIEKKVNKYIQAVSSKEIMKKRTKPKKQNRGLFSLFGKFKS